MGSRNVRASLMLLASTSFLVGCAVVDQYSGRAVVYNEQAEEAQDQALLLNIVRAYLRRPMQFTTVSSITGVASATAGAQYTLPVNVPFRPATNGASIATYPALPTWLFSGSVSGGPAFSVPVLDTAEFYRGIMNPEPGQLWDLYIQGNYPTDLLFNLFVEKVVMKRLDCPATDHQLGCEFEFDNYAGHPVQIDLFQALGDYVLALGLTTEEKRPITVKFGEPHANINIRYVGAPAPDGPSTYAQVVAPPGGAASSEGDVAPKSYSLCFAPPTVEDANCVAPKSVCGQKKAAGRDVSGSGDDSHSLLKRTCGPLLSNDSEEGLLNTSGSGQVGVNVSTQFDDRLIKIADMAIVKEPGESPDAMELRRKSLDEQLRHFRQRNVSLKFYLRSTEAMIYYIGEVARSELNPDFEGQPRSIFVKTQLPYGSYPENDPEEENGVCSDAHSPCAYLFLLREGQVPKLGGFLSVDYDGQTFSVPDATNFQKSGFSSLVLEILRQEIALNSSAKSLPQSSVLSVVGQ